MQCVALNVSVLARRQTGDFPLLDGYFPGSIAVVATHACVREHVETCSSADEIYCNQRR